MNLLTIRRQARLKSGIALGDYSNSDLDAQINQAYRTFCAALANLDENYFEEQHTKFNLVANSGLYSLPEDTIAVKQLRLAYTGTPVANSAYAVATPYDSAEVNDISADEENIPISNPIYELVGNFVRIKPKPTVAVVKGGDWDYITMPSALTLTGDTPIIPIQYHDKIAVYAAKEMAFKWEKWNKHDRLDKEWAAVESDLQNRLADRVRNRPLRFKLPGEAGTPVQRVREL
ncbi:hypothetical protein KW797_00485 [Candidatus Parcubacteria bacterium]|nr:hypothetical protein [Candidatus Parcubacteria bacterium]